MAVEIVFETHSLTYDNERAIATGWNDGRLSPKGRALARALGARRTHEGIAGVFSSDLGRAVQTVRLAFDGSRLPTLLDWRLRECDFGEWNGAPAHQVHADRLRFLDAPYPGGESWRDATRRTGAFVNDLLPRWHGKRILVVGHLATLWGLEQRLLGISLEEQLSAPFSWQEGWEFRLDS